MDYRIQPLEKTVEINDNQKHNDNYSNTKKNAATGFNDMLEEEKLRLKKIEQLRETKINIDGTNDIYNFIKYKKIR